MISVRLDTGQTVTFDDGTDDDTIKSVMAHVQAGTHSHLLTDAGRLDSSGVSNETSSNSLHHSSPILDLSHVVGARGPVPIPAANSAGIRLKLATPAASASGASRSSLKSLLTVGGDAKLDPLGPELDPSPTPDDLAAKRAELARIAATGDINHGNDGSASLLDVGKEFVSGLPARVVGTVSGAVTTPLRAAESVVKGLGTEIAQDVLNPTGATSTGEGFRRGAAQQWQDSGIGQAGDTIQRLVDPARQRLLDVSIKAGMSPEAAALTDTGQAAAAEALNPVNYIAPHELIAGLRGADAVAPAAVRAAELEAQGGARAIEGNAGLVTREFGRGSAPSEIAQQKLARDLAVPNKPLIYFDRPPDMQAVPVSARGVLGPIKGRIPDAIGDLLDQPWRTYNETVPLEQPASVSPRPRNVERDSLPLPPVDVSASVSDDGIRQVAGLWDYASRRYPTIASQIKKISISPYDAHFNYETGELAIPPDADLGLMMHEMTHAAQSARGQIPEDAVFEQRAAAVEPYSVRAQEVYGRAAQPLPKNLTAEELQAIRAPGQQALDDWVARGGGRPTAGQTTIPAPMAPMGDFDSLANTSLGIGSSPAAGARVPVQVVDGGSEGALRRLSAIDDMGNQIGSMTYTTEPGGGFRVIDVATGARGTGAGREMYAAAAAKEGPYRGSMAQTPEGEGFVNRLRETNPEIFAGPAPFGVVQQPDPMGQIQQRLYAGGPPPPTPLSEADTAAAMGWAHPLNQPGSPNAIIDPIHLQRPDGSDFQTNLAAQLGPKDGPRVAQWIKDNSDEVFRKVGPPQSWNTVEDMASRSGTTTEEFLRDNPRWNTLAPEERMRLSYVIKGNEREIGNLQSKLADGTATEEDKADLLRRIDNASDLIKIGAKSGSDYGRALNTLRIEARLVGDDQLLKQQIYRKYAQQLDREKPLMDTLARLNPKDPDELQALLRQVNKPKLREFMQEIFVNSILSSPVPFERKVIGDTIMMLGENGLVRPIAAVFDAARAGIAGTAQSVANAGTAAARDSFLVETPAAFVGLGRGIQKGFQRGIEVLRRGYDPRLAEGDALFVPRSAFARAESSFVRNVVGPFVTMPTRVISAATTMARTMNFTAELYAQAARVAAKEELMALKAGSEVPDTAARIAGLIANPTDEMLTAADKFAGRATFTDETSAVGKAILNLRDLPGVQSDNPAVNKALSAYRTATGFLLPFIHIADRLMVRGLEYTPLSVALSAGERSAGNYAEAASSAARATIGSTVMAYAASLAYQGRLTGAAPTNPAERAAFYAAGKQPFSIISDSGTVVPYGHMQPIAMPLALVASMHDGWQQNPNDDLAGKIADGAVEVGTHISDQSYLLTLSKLMEVLHGSEQGRAGRAASDLAAGTIAGMAPYSALTRTIAKTLDPRVIDDKSFSGKILQNVPVASLGLTGKLDPWGEEVVPQGGRARTFLASGTALLSSQLTPQPLDQELARLGMPLGYVGSTISDHKKQVKLSDDEHFQYQQLAGRASKLTIAAVIAREGYTDLDTEVQRSQITQAIGAARKYARIVTLRAHNNASNYPGLNPDLGSINMVNESARE